MKYHDDEWGVPLHDDRGLFELLILEGAQADLSWLTVLKKRDNYHNAFHGFDPHKVASYSATDVQRLLADPGIVRNRLKIESTIRNARGVLAIREEFGSFDSFIWRYVTRRPSIAIKMERHVVLASTIRQIKMGTHNRVPIFMPNRLTGNRSVHVRPFLLIGIQRP